MNRLYEGSAPCPGCGCSGSEKPRSKKEGLCYDCSKALEIGKSIVKERNLERNYYRLDDLVVGELTWYEIPTREVEMSLRRLLSAFSQFDKKNACGRSGLIGPGEAITAREGYVMPKVVFESAKELCLSLYNACRQLEKERRSYEEELEAKLAEQKNDIYNDGVERGRNLLFQLNNGEISLDDFSKRIKKF